MSKRTYKHLFGPVPSRRLGRSLGVDLVPLKTCSFNCVFCQAGRTPRCTRERREYVAVDEVLQEFDAWLDAGVAVDTVTLSGSGEPTLHCRFGDVLDGIRERCETRTALLSNGSLFWDDAVRAAACRAGVVKVSLSAWDQASLERINRPEESLRLEAIVAGLCRFRADYKGELWMEVVVLDGLNAAVEQMRHIARLARSVRPDRIHLNTVTRVPAERFAASPADAVVQELADLFEPRAEIVSSAAGAPVVPDEETVGERPLISSVDRSGDAIAG